MLCIDPHAYEAYLGLADCALGRGQPDEAIEELVGAAQDFAERGALEAAFALMTKALLVDPMRLELHIDVAELEASAGRVDMAISRLENLAHAYEAAGQYDEAMAVIEAAEAFAAMDRVDEAPEPGTTTLVTPYAALVEEVVAIEIDDASMEEVPSSVEVAPIEAVPVEVAASHTVPMQVMPPARTGDTFVGPAPGPRPRAEQSVARAATRRKQSGPALRWRPSTIQMQALTAEIPKPEQLVRSGPGVPRAVAPARTAPIVHAPSRRRADATVAEGSRNRPRLLTPVPKQDEATPRAVKLVATKPLVVKPAAAKAVVAKPVRKLEIRPLPGRAKPRPAPAPAPTRSEVRLAPAPAPAPKSKPQPTPRPEAKPHRAPTPRAAAPREAPRAASTKAEPKRTAPAPAPRKEGESLADRLRRQSTGRHHLAAKVKRIADAEKRRLIDGFDEDATTLWCPDNLELPEDRQAQS